MQDPRTLPGPRAPVALQTALYGLGTVRYLRWCHRRYGDVFTVDLPGGATMVVLADPQAIKEVFRLSADEFSAAASAPMLEPFVGRHSLLLMDGDRHHADRRVAARALSADGIGTLQAAAEAAIRRDIEQWPVGDAFALLPRMRAVTLEVILARVFGIAEGADEALRLALHAWLRQAGSLAVLAPVLRRDLRGHSPWGKFVRLRAALDAELDRSIAARRGDPQVVDRTDVLSILLATAASMTDAELRDALLTMVAAGHDTTATAVAWAVDLLLHNPEPLQRLRGELGRGDGAYLGAVVKEVLRMRPVIETVGRTLTVDAEIGGYTIPAGSSASPSILLAGADPDVYPDPMLFRPERFLDRPPDPLTWLPFGGGIRRCLGAAFATTEIETILRVIFTTTDLRAASPRADRPRRRAVTLIPAHGARVVLERRFSPQTLR